MIIGVYLPLTVGVTHHFERLNTGDASLPEHVSKGIVYSMLTYICMKSIKHERFLEKGITQIKAKLTPKSILNYTGELSVACWLMYNTDNLTKAIERVVNAPHSESAFWQELLTYFISTVALLSFPIYSLIRTAGSVIQNYSSAAKREVNLNMLNASLSSIAGRHEKAIALCEHVEGIAPEYAEPNAIKAQCLEKKGEDGAAFVELRKAREKREHYELSQRVMKSNLYAEQLWVRIESWFKLRKIRAAAEKEGISTQDGTAQKTQLILSMAKCCILIRCPWTLWTCS